MDQVEGTHSVSLLSYLPPGYRFEPREKELVLYYLYPKLSNRPVPSFPVIQFDEFRNTEPWTIWDKYPKIPGEDLYFFTSFSKVSNKRNGTNNVRKINGIGPGKWHGEDSSEISVSGNINAVKKRFKYKNPEPKDQREWIMYEYSIPSLSDKVVLCRLRNKEEHKEKDNDDSIKPQARKKRKRNCTDDDDPSVAGSTITSDHCGFYDHYDPKTPQSEPLNVHKQSSVMLQSVDNVVKFDDDQLMMVANAITKKKTKRDAASSVTGTVTPGDCHVNGLESESVSDNREDLYIDRMATNPITSSGCGVAPIISAAEGTPGQSEAAATVDNASEQKYLEMFNYDWFCEDQMAANAITSTSAGDDTENQQQMEPEHTNDAEEDAATEDFHFDIFLDDANDIDPNSFDNLECEGTDFSDANCWHSYSQMLLQANATDVYQDGICC